MRLITTKGTALTVTKLGITRKSLDVRYAAQVAPGNVVTAIGNYPTPTMGDFNNNGLVDLMLGQGDGTIRWYEQSAAKSTNFGPGTLLQNANGTALIVGDVNNANIKYAKPTLPDLDGNGLLELLVGEETGWVLRYEQVAATGTDALRFNRTLLSANSYGMATASVPTNGSYARPAVTDLDSNGLLDVLVGSNDGTVLRYEQTAANSLTFNNFDQMKLVDGTVIDAGDVDKPLLTDYNGDGYLDMLLGNKAGTAGTIALYTQSAANSAAFTSLGTLTTDGSTAISTASSNGHAAPAIIDGNGLLDPYVGNANGTCSATSKRSWLPCPLRSRPLPAKPWPAPMCCAGPLLRKKTAPAS